MIKIISMLMFFIFWSTSAIANNCDKKYNYFLDGDDKPDVISEKISSTNGYENTCSFILHLSSSGTKEYFHLRPGGDFFDSYEFLPKHAKDEIVIAYRKKDYQEIHHYKMLYRFSKFNRGLPYISSIDYIYPNKTIKKEFEEIKWSLDSEDIIIKNKDIISSKLLFVKYLDYKTYNSSSERMLKIINMGGGSILINNLLATHRQKSNTYSGYYLSLILKQFGLKDH